MDAAQVVINHAAHALALTPGPPPDPPSLAISMARLLNNMVVPAGSQDLITAMGGSRWAAAACTETMVNVAVNKTLGSSAADLTPDTCCRSLLKRYILLALLAGECWIWPHRSEYRH